jgi:hypothetical protein
MISSGSKSRLKKEKKGEHEARDHVEERGVDQERTHSRIVRFFDELLS